MILCETWVLKESSVQKLVIFGRKVLRKIFGPTKELNIPWRIKTNEEMDELIQRKNIIRFIKSPKLKWLGHV
jgi:hypothetical protein